jgi:L-ascorbate metabolism protein UlaG (beta-lactamase superfamily)
MKITKYGHACLLVEDGQARILIDPGAFSQGFEDLKDLDAILITHQHQDHVVPDGLVHLMKANSGAVVYADEDTAKMLAESQIEAKVVHEGDSFDVGGLLVEVFGANHAVIHPDIPGITNVGYLIGGRLFVPGDNFTVPEKRVEVLALPLGAPWSKVSEVIDYILKVKPAIAIPVHDAVLAMPEMHINITKRFTDPAGIEMRVVENGTSTEV